MKEALLCILILQAEGVHTEGVGNIIINGSELIMIDLSLYNNVYIIITALMKRISHLKYQNAK